MSNTFYISTHAIRCFISGGFPASSPAKSRLVEVMCIRLCDKHTQPRRDVTADRKRDYTSRLKLVLSDYNAVRACVANS